MNEVRYKYEVLANGQHVKWCYTLAQAESIVYAKRARVNNDSYRFTIKPINTIGKSK